ncbi:MAG: cytochrome P450 [Actinomycetia bacterium]|nr:cytochrome P450 [Actinomycetes bacterium]
MVAHSDWTELFAAEFLDDPYPLYDSLHAVGPVQQVGDSTFFLVSGWDTVAEAVNRTADFSSNLTATMVYNADGTVTPIEMDGLGGPTHVLATADDPVHAEHRKMVLPRTAAKRLRGLEPFIASSCAKLWSDGLVDSGIDWIAAVADRLPMTVVAHLIGLPHDDVDQLVAWGYASTQMLNGVVTTDEFNAASTAALELSSYLSEHFERAAGAPPDNLLGDLAVSCAAGELDKFVATMLFVQLVGAGGESTAGLLGNAAWILATHPAIQQRLRTDPRLLEPFIEETLRYESPFRGHFRHVINDTALAGVQLPAGSHLMLLWGAANRDSTQFEAPGEFRLDRPRTKNHMSFGKGTHFCLGAALARMEARIIVQMLLDRTTRIELLDAPRWVPSISVRRLEHLQLALDLTQPSSSDQ